ncbi:MAG: ABC transporter permease [bacterium]|nr:ABC transporter permease [bacterium]
MRAPNTVSTAEPQAGDGSEQERGGALVELWRTVRGKIGLILLAVFLVYGVAGLLLYENPPSAGQTVEDRFRSPSLDHLLGTDNLGRSVWEQLAVGAGISLAVGLAATAIAVLIGSVVGITSGYIGGRFDQFAMGVTDMFITIPALPLIIVLAAVLSRGLPTIIVVIGVTSWAVPARLIRAEVLSQRERTFILRAKAIGMRPLHIMWTHVLPNVAGIVLANAILLTAAAILTEAVLAFLGLGDPSLISWGKMLQNAFSSGATSLGYWWVLIPPGVLITLMVLSFTLIGNALTDVIDPRRREE